VGCCNGGCIVPPSCPPHPVIIACPPLSCRTCFHPQAVACGSGGRCYVPHCSVSAPTIPPYEQWLTVVVVFSWGGISEMAWAEAYGGTYQAYYLLHWSPQHPSPPSETLTSHFNKEEGGLCWCAWVICWHPSLLCY
jgi:hypothetical protein